MELNFNFYSSMASIHGSISSLVYPAAINSIVAISLCLSMLYGLIFSFEFNIIAPILLLSDMFIWISSKNPTKTDKVRLNRPVKHLHSESIIC